jgi:hypothetical protein
MDWASSAALSIVVALFVGGCAGATSPGSPSQALSSSPSPTPTEAPSCACSHPPTAPPGSISRDQAIAIALRLAPGGGRGLTVTRASIEPDPFVEHGRPGVTPAPDAGHLVWDVRLDGQLDAPSCGPEPSMDSLYPGPPAPSLAACIDASGGTEAYVDPLTEEFLGWVPGLPAPATSGSAGP